MTGTFFSVKLIPVPFCLIGEGYYYHEISFFAKESVLALLAYRNWVWAFNGSSSGATNVSSMSVSNC